MWSEFYNFFNYLLGLESEAVAIIHIISRTLIVYFGAILLFRINKQILGIKTVFNLVINILIGSILANGILGGGFEFVYAICAALTLVVSNWLLEVLVYYSPLLSKIFNGTSIFLIKDKQIQWEAMRNHSITQEDLLEELHLKLHTDDLSTVKDAYLETTGEISFIKKQ